MMPHILLVNDDGIKSPGLIALMEALERVADCTIVAPHGQTSWIGKASSYKKDLILQSVSIEDKKLYSLTGTPADCVQAGIYHLCPKKPDLVVSGINIGANVGDSYIYSSGTVGGALEAALSGIPGLAVGIELGYETVTHLEFDLSAGGTAAFEAAAGDTALICSLLLSAGNIFPHAYNLNFPEKPVSPRKITMTKPARYPYGAFLEPTEEGFHHKGIKKDYSFAGEGTDMAALRDGSAAMSVLPLYGFEGTAGDEALRKIIDRVNRGNADG